MMRALAFVAAVVLLLGSAGCGGGGSSPSQPTVTTSRAVLSVTQTSVGLLGLSSSPNHRLRLELPVQISNVSDVQCRLGYFRLQLFVDATEIERAEVTADDIVALAGTNLVTRASPLTLTLVFNFNSVEFTQASLTLGGQDEHGYTLERAIQNLEVEAAPELMAAREPTR